MSINIPNYRPLQNKLAFLTENVWEIRVPRRDNIEWAIVLSCLLSKPLFEKIKCFILPHDDIESIIENFNPFIDRVSFSQNDILKNIVKNFKDKLQASTDNEASKTEIDPKVKLKRASEFLNGNIYLFTKDMKSYDLFCPHDATSGSIILFKSGQGDVRNSFGLAESLCEKWREDALKNVLFKINIKEETFGKIWLTVKDSENFLIAILNSDERDIIEGLCDSPSIIRKLIDAGFQVDPVIKDSKGRSAFYHALVSRKTSLCISVYHLGIFCCAEDCLSVRKPSKQVITNLKNLQKTLRDDFQKIDIDENATALDSLISLRIEINATILKTLEKTRHPTAEQNSNAKFEIEQQRDILLSILNIYSKNLYQSKENDLENYVAYKYYFDVIDVDVSLFFFDYIFKLQKNLQLANEYRYADVESSFFIFLLFHDIFNRRIKYCDFFKKLENISTISANEIPFIIRKNEIDKIKHFYYDLIDTAIDKSVIRNDVPRKELYYTLHEYPEIKNYFLIKRLTGYIESALNIIEKTDWKVLSVFIIERVLQVIGEFMKMEPDTDFDVKWFLSLYIPKDVRKLFHAIRNNLSHFTSKEFTQKINLEKDMSLFKGIEDDIRSMHDYLQPLLNVMIENNVIHIEHILSNIKENRNYSQTYKQTFEDSIPAMIQSILNTENDSYHSYSFDNLINVFKCILEHLNEQFDEKYKEFKEGTFKNSEEKELEKLKKSLKPIKYLLELFKNKLKMQVLDKDYYETLGKILHKLENTMNLKNVSEFIDVSKTMTEDSKMLISGMKVSQMTIKLNKIQKIEKFFKSLKPSSDSTNGDKENMKYNLREEIIKKGDLEKIDQLKNSINDISTMDEEELSKLKISYLNAKEWREFSKFYKAKKYQKAFNILYTFKPLEELEKLFSKKDFKKVDVDRFCKRLRLQDDDCKKLEDLLVKHPQKKVLSNRLSHLLNRIKHLEKVLIDEENECMDLWTSQNRFLEKHIFNRYMEDENARMATEMLVLDCMNLLKKKKEQWGKSAGFFEGIDLRNVIAHQGIIIQNICEWFDPSDLPKDIVRIVIDLSKDKKAIEDILSLFKEAKEDFNKFSELLKSEGRGVNLVNEKNVLLEKYEKYIDLLPGADKALSSEQIEQTLIE